MANKGTSETKKLALLRILQILQKYSDCDHQMTQNEIAEKLLDEYGIEMERKAVARNVNLLREAGFEIPSEGHGTYLQGSESYAEMPGFDFEESELRLLIDSVLSSNHISGAEADALVDKLSKMGNKFFANSTKGIKKAYSIARVDTVGLFYNLSVVCSAMTDDKKISITELRYTSDSKLHEWRGSQKIISPFNVVAARGNYYLIGVVEGEDCFSAYRLERLCNLKEVNEMRCRLTSKMRDELENFITYHPLMSGGHVTKALMLINRMMLGDLVDAFGNNFIIKNKLKTEYYVEVEASEDELVTWAMRYAEDVEILSPESVRDAIRRRTEKMSDRYVNWKAPERYQNQLGNKLSYFFCDINLKKESEFRNLTSAKAMYFEHNNLTDFSFLRNFNALRHLSIVNNPVDNLPFFARDCKIRLRMLELSGTAVTDISFLNNMPDVRTIMLGLNPIKDYSSLYGLKKLKKALFVKQVADKLDLAKIRENNPNILIKIVDEYPSKFDRITGFVWKDGSKSREI